MTTLLLTAPAIAFTPARPVRRVAHRLTEAVQDEGKLGLPDLLVSLGQVGAALGFCLLVHGLA